VIISPDLVATARAVLDEHPLGDDEWFRLVHLHRSERSSTSVALIRAGHGTRPHVHRHHDEVIVYLEGEGDLRFGDDTVVVRAGDVVTVPAGTVHATFHARTDVAVVAVFSPGFDFENEDRVYVDGERS
jgi:mannose-6-phosphate isomerase-like protein (cupin superfamily)